MGGLRFVSSKSTTRLGLLVVSVCADGWVDGTTQREGVTQVRGEYLDRQTRKPKRFSLSSREGRAF